MTSCSHHTLLAVAVVALASLGIASVISGHDQLDLITGAILGLAGGAPAIHGLLNRGKG